jgi:hypothetical protein
MSNVIAADSIVRHRGEGRMMLVKAVFHDEDGSPNQVECEFFDQGELTTAWVHVSELDLMTRG